MKGALLPSREVFGDIGNLAFEQLSSLRHRGAFSTVSLTFTTCCQLVEDPLVTSPEAPAEETLLFSWYKVRVTSGSAVEHTSVAIPNMHAYKTCREPSTVSLLRYPQRGGQREYQHS